MLYLREKQLCPSPLGVFRYLGVCEYACIYVCMRVCVCASVCSLALLCALLQNFTTGYLGGVREGCVTQDHLP